MKLLHLIPTTLKRKMPIKDNSKEIEAVKAASQKRSNAIKDKSIKRSQQVAKGFEIKRHRVYDVAEKIYLSTGQNK